jgi:phosphoglycerate dehydrogenase-like enzyme
LVTSSLRKFLVPTKTTPKILVPGDDPVQLAGSPHLDRLKGVGEIVLYSDRPDTDEEKVRRAQDADVLINSRGAVKWPGSVLRQLPRLRFITVCGIGTDPIDLQTASEMGIVVSNIPGKTAPVVAEHAFCLMCSTAKRVAFQTAELKAGRWTKRENISLAGKTLGVVGVGPIGSQMARLGKAVGMRVIAWTFHPTAERAETLGVQFVELDELLGTSDVVSLHVKLTEESRHMIGERELALMKHNSVLVNTARGAIVDTGALVDSLKSGRLAGAALDVFETEPLPSDDPLLDCDNLVLTPHAADQTPEGCNLLNEGVVDNVIAFLEGRPRNVVT